jgi:hypothetical protein
VCDPTGIARHDDASTDAAVSTVAFAVGLVALAAGAALWFVAPAPSGERHAAVRTHPFAPALRASIRPGGRLPPFAVVER